MINFIKKLIYKKAVKMYKKQIDEFNKTISTFDKEKLAKFFIWSTWTRAGLQIEGKVFTNIDGTPNYDSDLNPWMDHQFQNLINHSKKIGNESGAYALKIWNFSIQGILKKELVGECKTMWEILNSSKSLWKKYIDEEYNAEKEYSEEFAKKTLDLANKILKSTPPNFSSK